MKRQTYLEVNLSNFKHNINEIKKLHKDKEIIPVIKANAYGTHINKRLDIINEFNIVAVAIVDEALYLRELGYKTITPENVSEVSLKMAEIQTRSNKI